VCYDQFRTNFGVTRRQSTTLKMTGAFCTARWQFSINYISCRCARKMSAMAALGPKRSRHLVAFVSGVRGLAAARLYYRRSGSRPKATSAVPYGRVTRSVSCFFPSKTDLRRCRGKSATSVEIISLLHGLPTLAIVNVEGKALDHNDWDTCTLGSIGLVTMRRIVVWGQSCSGISFRIG